MIVIDASAALELILQTPKANAIADMVLTQEASVHAPHLIDVEIAQVLRRLTRQKELTLARGKMALSDFLSLGIARHTHTPLLERVFELRDSMTAYDAVYVSLAEALNGTLVTCDEKLARAHGHRAVIHVISK